MVAGIDIGARFHVVSVKEDIKKFRADEHENIISFLIEKEIKKVILEPSGIYHLPLARELIRYGFEVYLIHSTRFGRFRFGFGRSKNDFNDAVLLRKYASFDTDFLYKIDEEYIEKKELGLILLEHNRLKKQLNREMNQLRRDLYIENPALAFMTPSSYKCELLEDLQLSKYTFKRIERIEQTKQLIKEIEKEIKKKVEGHEDGKILTSIPGISYITAGLLMSTYINVNRYKNVKQFKAMLGFGLTSKESGTSVNEKRSGKAHIPIRASLFRVVLVNANRDNKIGDYYREYRKRMPFRKAVMRTSAKLTEWIYYMLKHKKPFIS